MIQFPTIVWAGAALICLPAHANPQSSERTFETMAQPQGAHVECKAPRPPKDLAETAYIRNGYRAILRIMAAEKWKETGSCDCYLSAIKWEEVLQAGLKFHTSNDPRRPFDTSDLREKADDLLAQRDEACER
ncbi:hypothetical protein [Ruegeria sp. Ofav3-42]|uniref:hypothetical protein n=1 Tax=Ruegeria sp. Ofav3-42 TaxID=2917759 RepID=UPI001EF4F64E|nr:hypothetical protein [Ruegeria sp. Ofav3-42]MCG7521910.1 hypothetical protein [Ruegeria sp. Ofav3-42]